MKQNLLDKLSKTFLIISFFCTAAPGQIPQKQITINLSPIVVANGRYYFNEKRVRFDEISFMLKALNDDKIDHHFKTIQTIKDVRTPVIYGSLIYVLATSSNGQYSSTHIETNRNIMIGTIVFAGLTSWISERLKKKAVMRYNTIVLQPGAFILPENGVSIGIRMRF